MKQPSCQPTCTCPPPDAARRRPQPPEKNAPSTATIPRFAVFLPLAFETEGYHTDDLGKLLLGFAHKRAAADGLEGSDAKARARFWTDFWLNQFAMVHARFLARCVLNRAAACKDGANPPFTRASVVDVIAASSSPLPQPLPPPLPPLLPGTATGGAAAAPAR